MSLMRAFVIGGLSLWASSAVAQSCSAKVVDLAPQFKALKPAPAVLISKREDPHSREPIMRHVLDYRTAR
jgi:hypothetical protein